MSTLWTPGGERPIRREPEPPPTGRPAGGPGGSGEGPRPEVAGGASGHAEPGREPTEAEMARQMAELRDRLAGTPAEAVVANHAYGLFELAALHLSLDPPQLDQARLAIDALGYIVEGLGERLGDHAAELGAGLGQLRMAFVQIQAAQRAEPRSGGD